MTLRILIVGAGGTGGAFGARMIEAGADVTFLVRPRRAAQLAADGLVLRSPRGDATIAAPKTVVAGAIAAPFDAVILSCKAFDLESAMESVAPAVGPETRILPLLNGMAHIDTLAARFGEAAVLGGVAQISATVEPGGAIRQFGDMQAIILGERSGPASAVTQALAEATAPAGGRLSDEIMQEMWEKWVFIAAIAGATCLMRTTIGDIVAAGAAEIPLGLLEECAAVAGRAGHAPRPAAMERSRKVVTAARSPLTASMLRDIERGGPIEVEQIMGDLLARGEPDACRLLRVITLQLRAYEARRIRLG